MLHRKLTRLCLHHSLLHELVTLYSSVWVESTEGLELALAWGLHDAGAGARLRGAGVPLSLGGMAVLPKVLRPIEVTPGLISISSSHSGPRAEAQGEFSLPWMQTDAEGRRTVPAPGLQRPCTSRASHPPPARLPSSPETGLARGQSQPCPSSR